MTPLSDLLANAQLRSGELSELASGTVISGTCFKSGDRCSAQWVDLDLERCKFSDVDLSQSRSANMALLEVLFCRGSMCNTAWRGARMRQIEFQRSRLTGISFVESTIRSTILDHCKCDLSVFHDSKLEQCTFRECDLREVDFQNAQLNRVTFRDCDLRGGRFPSAKLHEVDFRGSQLEGIFIESDQLKGNTVDPSQLKSFSELLGLIVSH